MKKIITFPNNLNRKRISILFRRIYIYSFKNYKNKNSQKLMSKISEELVPTTSPFQPSTRALTPLSLINHEFYTFVGITIIGGVIIHMFGNLSGISESLKVKEYMRNYNLLEVQNKSKYAKTHGIELTDKLDEFMANTPNIKPEKGYLIKTPGNNFAYYFENERGEPFLLDNANNIWIWGGAEIKNPTDDWLVRTPEGEVYNFFINDQGEMIQKFIGNDDSLKVIPDTNLGTVVGFTNEEINDIHYRALPVSPMESDNLPKISNNHHLPPPILDEGLGVFPTTDTAFVKKNSSKLWDVTPTEEHQIKINSASSMDLIDIAEEDIIDIYQKKGLINLKEAHKLKNDLELEIKEEANLLIKGIDVGDLTTATGYVKMNLNK
jgi:hypothetical protein